ncbi:MAG: alpha/beta fold hydrolase [Betaproteobacteria bacterium]|jgi:predicted alpha/beta-fold hydrolase|nr:alpha/beta fold hydrolase [Betaproteobacteria bacterium]
MSGEDPAAPPPYRAPAWLPGGHAQTIWPYFLRRPEVAFRRERVATPDGDFWLFDWLDTKDAGAPLVVLFHGLEGSSGSHYVRALFVRLAELGWAGVVPHFRGCADEPNRLPRAYHSGDHEEIDAMLAAVRKRIRPERVVHACGVSLGGSALLNWLGRRGRDAKATLASAAAVSVPLDLMAAGRSIDAGANRVYAAHFLMTLKPKADAMAARFPGRLDASRIASVRSMWEFDDLVTAPLHGFAGTADYWTRASSKPWLAKIALPTLVLNARNDPFVPGDSLPSPAEVSAAVVLEQPEEGGHAGFATGPLPGRIDWLPQRLIAFFASPGPRAPHG